jgi:site-specific DNA-methyltransferase (adenine-specific)
VTVIDCFAAPGPQPQGLPGFLGRTSAMPDVLDSLANLSSDEVFTPPSIANAMLDLLPGEVWSDPSLRWLDPATKSGVFLREAARRLMVGLAEVIPDEAERREHIFKRMLHGIAITELTGLIARRSLYYSKDASSKYAVVRFECDHGNVIQRRSLHTFSGTSCSICGAPKSLERGEGKENHAYPFIHDDINELFPNLKDTERFPNMKFDVIIGNPPYQLQSGGYGAQATPLYHKFVEKARLLDPRFVVFIIPARWYAGGMGLDAFRGTMLADRSLKVLVDHPDASSIFPGVEIKGGICYFLRDNTHQGDCKVVSHAQADRPSIAVRDLRAQGDVLVRSNEAIAILSKVEARDEVTLNKSVSSLNPFALPTNYDQVASKQFKGAVRLYMRGGPKWVARSKITKNQDLIDRHKVLIPKAGDGSGSYPIQVLGKPIVAEKASACTMTYLVAGHFVTSDEAANLAAYLRTRFARYLVSLRKATQDTTKASFAFVPALDMTVTWTDEMLAERYGLTDDEVAHIEKMIKEMPA